MMIPSPQQLATFRKEREIRRARVRKILIDRGLEHVAESLGSKKVLRGNTRDFFLKDSAASQSGSEFSDDDTITSDSTGTGPLPKALSSRVCSPLSIEFHMNHNKEISNVLSHEDSLNENQCFDPLTQNEKEKGHKHLVSGKQKPEEILVVDSTNSENSRIRNSKKHTDGVPKDITDSKVVSMNLLPKKQQDIDLDESPEFNNTLGLEEESSTATSWLTKENSQGFNIVKSESIVLAEISSTDVDVRNQRRPDNRVIKCGSSMPDLGSPKLRDSVSPARSSESSSVIFIPKKKFGNPTHPRPLPLKKKEKTSSLQNEEATLQVCKDPPIKSAGIDSSDGVREVNHVETMIERSEKMKERRRRTSDLKTQSDCGEEEKKIIEKLRSERRQKEREKEGIKDKRKKRRAKSLSYFMKFFTCGKPET